MGLDSFLNTVIPIGIIIFFIGILYSRLKTEIHAFIDWIRGMLENTKEKIPEMSVRQIIYD